ncbi:MULTISPECIES: hypothetical protein [unclassified Streptomyces]|uniref:hypothetical protein n=1 Tax=unclassified Streptomyces TaxID=2593676 RepID=UPI0036EC9A87
MDTPPRCTRRSRVIMVEPVLTQPAKLTASETHRLDRAIVAISVNPELGTPVPSASLGLAENQHAGLMLSGGSVP